MRREVIVVKVPPPKERAPHRPTKAHSTKKDYDRKREKKRLREELEDQKPL